MGQMLRDVPETWKHAPHMRRWFWYILSGWCFYLAYPSLIHKECPTMEWTTKETRALITLYNRMLKLESKGMLGPRASAGQTSKATLVRDFMDKHSNRSKGSVEAKLMNLSAVRQELNLHMVTGYAPLANMATECRTLGEERWA